MFNSCGKQCSDVATCSNYKHLLCTLQCVPKCECPVHLPVWEGDRCVSLQHCERMTYAKEGEQVPSVAENNQLLFEQIKSLVTPNRELNNDNHHINNNNNNNHHHINNVEYTNEKLNRKRESRTRW